MNLFDMSNPFWQFLGKLFDVVILNLLWMICCIPVVTVGPATAAVYGVCMGLIQDRTSSTWRAFFRILRRDWKQSLGLGLILLAMAGLLGIDLWYFLTAGNWMVCAVSMLLAVVIFASGVYAFVLLGLFENTVIGTLRNALILTLRHPIRSLGVLVSALGLTVGAVLSLIYFPMLSTIFLIFGPALWMFLHCLILFPVVRRYLPDEENEE